MPCEFWLAVKKQILEYYVGFSMIFFLNILMSFNVWNFSFNELCVHGQIIQSYINNIYIWAWSTQNALWSAHFFVKLFLIIQLFIVFQKWPHMISTSFYTHVCPSHLFFTILKNWKTKDTLLKRTRRCVMMCIFMKFLEVYILPCRFFFKLLRSSCLVF